MENDDVVTMAEYLEVNGIELGDSSPEDMIALSGLGVYKSVQCPGEHDGEIEDELISELRSNLAADLRKLTYPRKLKVHVS